jgi:excisionase family DNA binding protein
MTALLTVKETATELRVSPNTVYRMISDGSLRTVDIGREGRAKTRVARKEIDRFIQAHERGAA